MVRYYGKGIVNSLINNLPFELHSPGYNYLGPGTNLHLKEEKEILPINKLDEAAKEHDISYDKYKDLSKRHEADKILEEKAKERIYAKDASLSEKVNAYLTSKAMCVKRKCGMGIQLNSDENPFQYKQKLGKYLKQPINLSEDQQKEIYSAVKNEKGVTIKLEPFQLRRTKESVMRETYLPLSQQQINAINKHVKNDMKKIFSLKLSQTQLKCMNNNEKIGGFLPAVLPFIPAIGAAVTAGSSLYKAYNDKKTNDKLLEEKIRHNKVLEDQNLKNGNGLLLKKSGDGLLLKKSGNGLLLKKNLISN